MPEIVTEPQVQQWLGPYKLTVDDIEDEHETSAKNIVFSTLSKAYDVSTWIDSTSTPALVQEVMSLFIAAWIYARAYSEDETAQSGYVAWLEAKAYSLLAGIASGDMDLPEVPGTVTLSGADFYPKDDSIADDGYTLVEAKFGMDKVF